MDCCWGFFQLAPYGADRDLDESFIYSLLLWHLCLETMLVAMISLFTPETERATIYYPQAVQKELQNITWEM